ncbi:head morphogenesis protein [Acuticoccus sp. M5D2P5]|uniref:phage minor head protein n=1 Tax=Acuticoccus kalidii TaxID=2910977 RepID=UPI001F39CF2F|nr:phage minor head protein [Acuticoccus kalidii]MCF3934344.1 head morphogenesis protein [Acuticoccus kalidii]
MARKVSIQKRLEAIAARLEPGIQQAFIDAMRASVTALELRTFIDRLSEGDIEGAISLIEVDEGALSPMIEQIRQSYSEAGNEAAGDIPKLQDRTGRQVVIRFNMRSPRAEQWLAEMSSRMVTEIRAEQRQMIRANLTEGMVDGRNPRNVALDLVGRINKVTGRREGGVIGLTRQQAQWVANAREELSGGPDQLATFLGRCGRDRRFDRTITAAMREGRALSVTQVNRISGRYADRLLQLRGETIARTEMLGALNSASKEAFDQALDTGIVREEQVTKTWRSAGDGRVRESHQRLNRETVGHNERFSNGLLYPHEPGAPAREVIQCRCIASRRIDFLAGFRAQGD